jgi:predicted esterase
VGPVGLHRLAFGSARVGFVYVPTGYQPDRPAPLAVMLHGAGGIARHGLNLFLPYADDAGLVLLAPVSRASTWDVVCGRYGPDVAFVDAALAHLFARYNVDPVHVAIGGFSDGASYALSLGLTNGDLFTHVVAFSPGFMAPAAKRGRPRIFISHGTRDETLPIDVCSGRIVPILRASGYDVHYHEFDGPHTVPPAVAREALDWFLSPMPK